MSVEKPSGLNDLNVRWPLSTDHPTEGDNHIRLIKEELVKAFALFDTPITVSSGQINGVISKLKALGATLTSSVPFFAPNPGGTDNTTRVSTTHWVRGQVKAAIAPLQTAAQVTALIAAALKNYYTKAQVYTKGETASQIATALGNYYTKSLVYTRTEVAAKIVAALGNYYTKAQVYTKAEVDARIVSKLTNHYTKAQINDMIAKALADAQKHADATYALKSHDHLWEKIHTGTSAPSASLGRDGDIFAQYGVGADPSTNGKSWVKINGHWLVYQHYGKDRSDVRALLHLLHQDSALYRG